MTSAFGAWASENGLPVFRETTHPDADACAWDPVVGPVTKRHWCALGNRRLQVVFDNHAKAAIRDTANGFRWLTPRGGTGATAVDDWATDRERWPSSWSERAPVRTWGPTWFTVAGEHDGLRITRTVALPEGETPWVLVRVELTADTARSVTLAEEWEFVDDSTVLVSLGEEDLHVTTQEVGLAARVPVVRWFAVGLLDEVDAPGDPAALWAASLAALKKRLPVAECEAIPALAHEIPWHVALLTGGACVDNALGGHTLDQGSAYSFDLGFNGAARDPLQHALPLVYTEPDLALSVLRNTCAWGSPAGTLPYALDGAKAPITEWFDPSDQALWSLWLAAEYFAATGDAAAFSEPTPFHPVYETTAVPLVNHLVAQFRDLVDRVGIGEHGHIRILNADWNDSALTLAPVDRALMEGQGESVLNSAMAAWVLPRFAGLLRKLETHAATADEAETRANTWRELVASEWNGRWFRRAYGPGAVIGDDDLWLEVQPWAILCGAAHGERAKALLATIDEVVRAGSPLGARVRGPAPIVVPEGRVAGEGSAGGVWFSINMTLAWAARSLAPELAWDELRRMTLANHTELYPSIWEGTLSGPDAYNTPESPRPGATWAWPARAMGMQSFPVNNLHSHSQVVFTYLRLLGVEPTPDCTLRSGSPAGTFASRVFRAGSGG